jgi:hypothetical protein
MTDVPQITPGGVGVKRKFQCSLCTQMYSTEKGLKSHVSKAHLSTVEQLQAAPTAPTAQTAQTAPTAPTAQQMVCEYCLVSVMNKYTLKTHYNNCKIKNNAVFSKLQADNAELRQRVNELEQRIDQSEEMYLRLQEIEKENQELRIKKLVLETKLEESEKMTKFAISQSKGIKINNQNSCSSYSYNNINFSALLPVTNSSLQTVSSSLVANPEQPVFFNSVVPYVNKFMQGGLKESIVCLDASRNKILWIDGDNNNQKIRDNNGLQLAYKVMNATANDFALLAQKADEKFHELMNKPQDEFDGNKCLFMTESRNTAACFSSTGAARKEVLDAVGKAFAKASMMRSVLHLSNTSTGASSEEMIMSSADPQE